MNFSILGWIDGISGSAVVIAGIFFGIFFFYQGNKKNAKLLKQLAFVSIFAGLMYLGVLLDFFSLLTTGINFPNDTKQVPLLSYIWFPPVVTIAIYIVGQIEFPEKAKYLVLPYLVLGAIFYVLIFSFPHESFYSSYYEAHVPRLIDYNINLISPAGIFLAAMLLPVVISFGVGLLIKAFKTSGTIKKKFILLAMGAFTYGIAGVFEGFTQPGVGVILVRILYLSSFWLMYYGLRPLES